MISVLRFRPLIKVLGGSGSGNFGHAGRPGEVGGSRAEGGPKQIGDRTRKRREYYQKNKEKQRQYHKERYEKLKAEGVKRLKDIVKPVGPPVVEEEDDPNVFGVGIDDKAVDEDLAERAQAALPVAPNPNPDQAEHLLASSPVNSVGKMGGGINPTYLVNFADGTKGVFKPVGSDEPGVRAGIADQGSAREVAAYEIAKLGGVADLVQPTIFREVGYKEYPQDATQSSQGSLQAFLPDAKTGMEVGGKPPGWGEWHNLPNASAYGTTETVARAAMFDYITGNQDRHAGNWMIAANGDVKLIDHGLILGETKAGNSKFNQGFLGRAAKVFDGNIHKGYSPKEYAQGYVGSKSAIQTRMQALNIPAPAISRMMNRIDKAATATKWADLYGDGF